MRDLYKKTAAAVNKKLAERSAKRALEAERKAEEAKHQKKLELEKKERADRLKKYEADLEEKDPEYEAKEAEKAEKEINLQAYLESEYKKYAKIEKAKKQKEQERKIAARIKKGNENRQRQQEHTRTPTIVKTLDIPGVSAAQSGKPTLQDLKNYIQGQEKKAEIKRILVNESKTMDGTVFWNVRKQKCTRTSKQYKDSNRFKKNQKRVKFFTHNSFIKK